MRFDALVIGGGPGGSTAALLLARAGWSVAVVEKSRFPRQKVCGEFLSATNYALWQRIGIQEEFLAAAGPRITEVGLFAGNTILTAPLPLGGEMNEPYGRALGRDQLDTTLLRHAASHGAEIFQPYAVTEIRPQPDGYVVGLTSRELPQHRELQAGLIIAAHGSWEQGQLPTQTPKMAPRAGDLFGFKARFLGSTLPSSLMPLLAFPGGYGGMVHTNGGRVSLSCCVRRDRLAKLRQADGLAGAGDLVLGHLKKSCRGVQEALAEAQLDGPILSAGPIRPGIRQPYREGIFCVGNAAGEAHPIIAEGISMALQAAWLLAETILARKRKRFSLGERDEIGREYSGLWRANFASRIRAASGFAGLVMRPALAGAVLPLIKLFPQILTVGAFWSGKANTLVLPVLPERMAADISA